MQLRNKISSLLLACSIVLLAGCGSDSTATSLTDTLTSSPNTPVAATSASVIPASATGTATDSNVPPTPTESYIDYLTRNHAAYANAGTVENPSARFNDASYSLLWLITAQTAEQAENLKKHIEFMGSAMANGGNPRPWDKLFLADAYMKTARRYETRVSISGYNVLIEKVATDACAYQLLKAHAMGVSGKFFEGNTMVDFSPQADAVIASAVCATDRSAIEAYIVARLRPVPKGIQKNM